MKRLYTTRTLKLGNGLVRKLPRLNDRKRANISNISPLTIDSIPGLRHRPLPSFKVRVVYWFVLLFPLFAHAEDPAMWGTLDLDVFANKCMKMSVLLEHRTSEGLDETELSFVSTRLRVHALPNLDLGVNGTVLRIAIANGLYQQRLELEANPHWKFCKTGEVYMRNRVELRKIQGQGGDSSRIRQGWLLKWPSWCRWTLIHSNEVFYDLEDDKFTQNRFIPILVNRKFSEKASISTYYMLRRVRVNTSWPSTHIIGIRLHFGSIFSQTNVKNKDSHEYCIF